MSDEDIITMYRPSGPNELKYVTRFKVRKSFVSRYKIHQVGAVHHTEWWIPAEDLEELNNNIVGKIEVIGEYRND